MTKPLPAAHTCAGEYPQADEIAAALAAKTGASLTGFDYCNWMEPEDDASYERFDAAARKLLGPNVYAEAEQAARLFTVLEVALGRTLGQQNEQRLAQAILGSPQEPAPDCEPKKVEEIKLGTFVKRKADATKVYRRGGFDRATKRFALVDCDDINREIWVKRGTILFVGFTY